MYVNLRSYKIRKILSLVDFHSSYQLLHSQVYRNDLKHWIYNIKTYSLLINEGESNKNLLKMFANKNLQMTQKSFSKKDLTWCKKNYVKLLDVYFPKYLTIKTWDM